MNSSDSPDHAALAGTWQMLKAELAGEAMPEFAAARIELEIDRRSYHVRFEGQTADRGTYSLEPGLSPKAMVMVGLEGPNAGRTIPCIYQLAGNRLRVCYGLGGIAPVEFATAKDSTFYMATYQRKTA
jgi:uncharacterized protein (TIGR03067 family)